MKALDTLEGGQDRLPQKAGETTNERHMLSIFSGAGRSALLGGAFLSLCNGILYSWSVFMLPIERATGWSRTQTSLVFTAILLFFGLGMMLGGTILRLAGTRRTAALGSCMLALGLAASACATAPWQLVLAYGVVAGFGIGMAYIVPLTVAVSWFPEHRGFVCGLMAFSLSLGTLVLGSGLANLLISHFGIAAALWTLAGLVLAGGLPASGFLRLPPPAALSQRASDGCSRHASAAEHGPGGAGSPASAGVPHAMSTRGMLKTRRFRLIWCWAFAIQAGGLMVIGHIVPYAVGEGASVALAGIALGVYAMANGLGRLLFGALYDAAGFRRSMLADAFCMLGGLLALAFLPAWLGAAGLLVGTIIVGMACGGAMPQFSAYIAQNFGTANFGNNLGMTATAVMAAGFAGPFMGGWLYSETGSYAAAMLLAGCLVLPGIAAVALAPPCPRLSE